MEVSVADGTVLTSLITLAGRVAPVGELAPAEAEAEFPVNALMTRKATTITTTPRMLPPAMKIRFRRSRRRSAARCAAIRSRALSPFTLLALPISRPREWCYSVAGRVHGSGVMGRGCLVHGPLAAGLTHSPQPRQRSGLARRNPACPGYSQRGVPR